MVFASKVNACTLISSDSNKRVYSFKCGKDTVDIKCRVKIESVCHAQITNELSKSNFTISGDQLKELDTYSNSNQKISKCGIHMNSCDISQPLCNLNHFFETKFKKESALFEESKHCVNSVISLPENIFFAADFSKAAKFSKDNCSSEAAIENLAKQVESFKKKSLDVNFFDESNFYKKCLYRKEINENKALSDSEVKDFIEINKEIAKVLSSNDSLKKLTCSEENNYFEKDNKINFDKLFCDLVARASVGLNLSDKSYEFSCKADSGHVAEVHAESNLAASRASSYRSANIETTPAEQKPLPQVIQNESGRPVGLMPALAQIDKIAPGDFSIPKSGSSSSGTEHVIAVGATRNSAAIQAGQAFAPVYEKLSRMADAANVLGSSSGAQIAKSRSPSNTSIEASGVVPGNLTKNIKASNGVDAGSVGGARGGSALGRNSSGSVGFNASADLLAADISTIRVVKDRLSELNPRDAKEVRAFFLTEAKTIEDIRSAFYGDKDIQELLKNKGIAIIGQKEPIGAEKAKANYVFSDNGKTFISVSGRRAK